MPASYLLFVSALPGHAMPEVAERPVVHIIDDDESVQRAFSRVMRSAGFHSIAYSGVDEFLRADRPRGKACIISDVRMVGSNTLDLPGRLKELGISAPVIFVTAEDNEEILLRARRSGAAGCFRKPIDDQALIDTICWATGEDVNSS